MKSQILMILLASAAVLTTTAMAQNPVDVIVAPFQEHINQTQGEIQQKVVQNISEGNLTPEHLQKDVNATKE